MTPISVAVIGAGPRGLTAVERLTDIAIHKSRSVVIHVIDPYEPGAGRVWKTDQSPELLMNTVVSEQTVFPDTSCTFFTAAHTGSAQPATNTAKQTSTGPSMEEWFRARTNTAGSVASASNTGSTGKQINASGTDNHGEPVNPRAIFGSRVLYGQYLRDAYAHVKQRVAGTNGLIEIIEHRATATELSAPDTDAHPHLIRLDSGKTLLTDYVVLSVGHIPARLTDERKRFADFASRSNLHYYPPSLPAETPVHSIPAGATVILRGFGLNYFDLQALLTTGRGGIFRSHPKARHGWELEYVPSGREPRLVPSSRRGVPYRCKPITPEHPLHPYELRFFTPDNIARLEESALPPQDHAHAFGTLPHAVHGPEHTLTGNSTNQLFFDDQLWPLILADIRLAWYTALHAAHPDAFVGELATLTEALAEAVDRHLTRRAGSQTEHQRIGRETFAAPAWQEVLDHVVTPAHHIDLTRLNRPMDGVSFADRAGLDAWMRNFLTTDLAEAHAGPTQAPHKALFAVLWAARSYLKELIAQQRIAPVSLATEVRGWFEAFVSGICDGPPPRRFAELLALMDAGIVTCVGPNVRITSSGVGEPAAFVAKSPATVAEVRAEYLIDAASPANQIQLANDALISGLLDTGTLAVATVTGNDGVVQPLSGLHVNPDTLRPVDRAGREHERLFVLSLQLSALRLGQAIAANPGSNARSLQDAHRVASQILLA